ncbi:MAG TPA: hypothetical protein VGF65_06035 [Mycobacterium sp.]|jgi:hypothetical protein
MAALDFPASPADQQLFVAPNGTSYRWLAAQSLWVALSGSAAIAVGDTPPTSPVASQLWWNSTLGQLFIWYNDGNSTQWVPATPQLATAPSQVAWRLLGSQLANNSSVLDFRNFPADINKIKWACSQVLPSVNDAAMGFQIYDGTNTLDVATNHYFTSAVWSSTAQASGNAPQVTAANGVAMMYLPFTGAGNNVSSTVGFGGFSGEATLYAIRNTTAYKTMTYRCSYVNGLNNALYNLNGGGYWVPTSMLTGLRFLFSGAVNMVSGQIDVWGSP